jgi:hypothetical protein
VRNDENQDLVEEDLRLRQYGPDGIEIGPMHVGADRGDLLDGKALSLTASPLAHGPDHAAALTLPVV